MADIVDIGATGEDLRSTLSMMDAPELLAQQIVQEGALHALTTLLARGCSKQVAQSMLESLRANKLVIEEVARERGGARLFAATELADPAPAGGKPAAPASELPDAIRVPLDELDADAAYIVGRVAADGSCSGAMVEAIRKRTRAIREALHAARVAPRPLPFDAGYVHAYLKAALASVEPEGLTDPQAAYFLEWFEAVGTADAAAPCGTCGQTDQGQTGEYACAECGLPTVWDAAAAGVEGGKP